MIVVACGVVDGGEGIVLPLHPRGGGDFGAQALHIVAIGGEFLLFC